MAAASSIIISLFLLARGGDLPRDTVFVEERFLGSFQQATRVATDNYGNLFVVDPGRDMIVRIAPNGGELSVGGHGWEGSAFDTPAGLATDGLNIYVADYGNHRVSRFDRTLSFVSSLSTRDTSFSRARFGYPLGVALSRQGDLFVLDGENLRVVKFNSFSQFERSFGDREIPRGKLRHPLEVVVSSRDKVHVLEDDRVVEFDYAGNFVREHGRGLITGATGIAETRNGFVVSTARELLWFDDDGRFGSRTRVDEIVSGFPLVPVKDVGIVHDRVLILTANRVGIFRMSY